MSEDPIVNIPFMSLNIVIKSTTHQSGFKVTPTERLAPFIVAQAIAQLEIVKAELISRYKLMNRSVEE